MSRGVLLTNLTARRYAKQAIADPISYEKKLELTRKYFTPETELLEIGCGTGSTALLHAPYVKHIDAIDYSREMIKIANEKLNDGAVTNVSFSMEDLANLGAKTKRYDAVLGMNIIHLVEDQEAVLKNIHDVLKPGGVFMSSTICGAELPWWGSLLLGVFKTVRVLPNIQILSEQVLIEKICAAGFAVEEQWNHGDKFKVLFLVVKKVG